MTNNSPKYQFYFINVQASESISVVLIFKIEVTISFRIPFYFPCSHLNVCLFYRHISSSHVPNGGPTIFETRNSDILKFLLDFIYRS